MANQRQSKRDIINVLARVFVQSEFKIDEKTLRHIDAYRLERTIKEEVESERLKRKLRIRQERHNKNFVWTPEKVEKVRDFNEKMWFRYKEAYDEVCRLKKECDERFASGDKNYESYDIRTEFWYNHDEEGLSEKEKELWDDLCEETVFWGPEFVALSRRDTLRPFEEIMIEDGYSWNEYPFYTKELDDICIHYFMHDIFNHNNTYSLEDLMKMKPENFSWQVIICLEHWGKSGQKIR